VARKPTLSPSKITTYLACPVRYRWTYADDRGKWYLRARSCYSFGSSLHRALERFHDSADSGVSTVSEALAAYEESWIEAGFANDEEMAEAFGDGKAIIERHVEEFAQQRATMQTLFVEKSLRHEYPHFTLVGRVDRVDEHEDGSLEIIDYKSGRTAVSPADVHEDIAMGCYQLLLSKLFPDRTISLTILALRTGAKASASLSADELAGFERDLVLLGDEIVTVDDLFERVPVRKALCEGCDFVPLCARHPEFGDQE
jgi:putative RecB family exonuclease